MNVVPKSPSPQSSPSAQSQTAQDARSKAIAAFQGGTQQGNPQPVPNASQIAPEEMGALGVQAENDKDETPEVITEPPKKEEPLLSPQHAILARKEKALRAQIQQFKAEQAKFQAEQESLRSAPKPSQEIDLSRYVDRDRLKSDPYGVLTELGLSYDEVTQAALSYSEVRTDPRVTAQMAKLEKMAQEAIERADKLEQASKTSQEQSYQQAVAQIKSEASKLVYTDPSFEMIKETNSVSDVVELIESTFKADGILMTVEEACQAVEEHLLEEAIKLNRIKKLQQKLGQPAAAPTPVKNTQQPQPNAPKTLTNGMAASKPMSVRERAIAAMQGKLVK